MTDASRMLLSLYREARSRPTPDFQSFAIQTIRGAIDFSSAVWTTGYLCDDHRSPFLVPLPSLTYTYETNPDGVEAWKAINRTDRTIPIVFANPFRTQRIHTPALFAAPEDLAMRDYARQFGRQNALITSLSIKGAPIVQWCSLYRPRADDMFSRREIKHCNLLMAHLSEGLKINRLLHQVDAPTGADVLSGECAALVAADGTVINARPDFIAILQRQWREFDGRRIPALVMRELATLHRGTFRTRDGLLLARRVADLWWMTTTPLPPFERLPPRRMDAATLYAQGYSHKDVARLLGISPATVRNHIAASYRTLGASNRSELRAQLTSIR